MAAVTTVVDGNIKFREGKKWKSRWCVLKKPSPVADHLQLVLYKDVSEACKPGGKVKAMYTVDSFFGLEAEICVDREQHVLAIICLKNVFLLAFELRESMIRFEIKIRQSLGEENQFPVKVVKAPSSSKLPKDQLCLIIHDTRFCLSGQTPPKIFMSWNVEDLRRYIARDDKFIFEAGARCGKGSGLFAVQSEQANDIADIINLASSGKMSNCHRKFKNRRRESIPSTSSSSDAKEVNPRPAEYTTISIPLTNRIDAFDRDESEGVVEPSPESSIIVPNSLTVERNSISSDNNGSSTVNDADCNHPAKSVLRPRAGSEYIVVKRISTLDSTSLVSGPPSAGLVSQSPSLSQVFDYNDAHHHQHYCKSNHHHHHHHLHHHHHNHPVSSCTSLSLCSQRTTPQRSPSFSRSTTGIAQSQSSLQHEALDRDSSSHHTSSNTPQHNMQKSVLLASHNISVAALSTPSPSPKTPSSLCKHQHIHNSLCSSPKTKKNSSCLIHSALTEEDNIFFPIDMTYNGSSPLSPSFRRYWMNGGDNSHHQPIYVNQHFVDIHYSQSSDSRTNSTCSSQTNPSPLRSYMQTHRSLLQDSFPSSNSRHVSDSNSLSRKSRMRSRHSESDVGISGMDRLSKSFTLPSNHYHHRPSLTLPVINVQRSHSDPKRADHLQPRQSVSQSHIHGKEFDKFANSSIIARRRQKHSQSNGGGQSPPPIMSRAAITSESSPNLQIPSINIRTSGYKNIDRFSVTNSIASSNNCHSADGLAESQPSSSLENQNDAHIVSNSPPPLPIRQRLVSTPSTVSPPLTPFLGASSDISDSPPPYNAPPPPDSHRSEPYLTPSSSEEEEQELNYIEIDMSTKPSQVEEPPLPLSFSRRSKRARQQRKLAKLRYAEIDHTATKALQHTGKEHAQTRRGGDSSKSGSSLSRMNSAPISKNHKPLTVRERKHSTGSVESL